MLVACFELMGFGQYPGPMGMSINRGTPRTLDDLPMENPILKWMI